jgi:hypothetical protein
MLASGLTFLAVMIVVVVGCWAMEGFGAPRKPTDQQQGDLVGDGISEATTLTAIGLTLAASDSQCGSEVGGASDCPPQG